jgi:hypothetical protein
LRWIDKALSSCRDIGMLEHENEKLAKGQRFTWDDLKAEIERQEAESLGDAPSKSKETEGASPRSGKHGKLPRSYHQPTALTGPTAAADELTNTDIENIKLLPVEDRARLLLKLQPSPSVTKLSKEFFESEIMTLREQAAADDTGLTELDRRIESQQDLCMRVDRALRVYHRNVLQPQRQWHRTQVLQNFNKPQISRVLASWAASEVDTAFHAVCIKGIRFGIRILTTLRKW